MTSLTVPAAGRNTDILALCRKFREIGPPPVAELATKTLGWLAAAHDNEEFRFSVEFDFWAKLWRLLGGGELRPVDGNLGTTPFTRCYIRQHGGQPFRTIELNPLEAGPGWPVIGTA